jgi:transposase
MMIEWSKVKIFVKPGNTDMRKQINGLSVMIQDEMQVDIFSGNLFLFCGKTRKRLKILYWDRNGFCLWMKRLEKDKFPWPKTGGEALEIPEEKLRMLLEGIDFFNAHQRLHFSEV